MGKSEPPGSPLVRETMRELRIIEGALDSLLDRIDRLKRKLLVIMPDPGPDTKNPEEVDMDPVAYNLDIRRRPNGSIQFVIDSGKPFSLPPRLAEVLQYLAAGAKDSSGQDALVGWRSRTDIIGHLEKRAGKPFRRAYINQMVYLLKCALRDAEYDEGLIQTHPVKGVRLAYKPPGQGKPHPWMGGPSPQS